MKLLGNYIVVTLHVVIESPWWLCFDIDNGFEMILSQMCFGCRAASL